MELLLIRHGLPLRSAETSNPPLSPTGHEQARRVGERLAGENIDVIVASTMRRAIQTAEPLAARKGQDILQVDGIVEYDRDGTDYIPNEDLKREDYAAWRAMADGSHDVDILGFQATVVAAMEEIVASHPGKTVAVFCHGGVINVWTAHVLGMAPRLFFEPGYASVHRYLCSRGGHRGLHSLNDLAHLRD